MDEIEQKLTGDPDRPVLPPGIDSDEVVLVSRRVVGGQPILFAWRDQPDDDDSGWTLLAGTEPDSFLVNRHKFVEWSVAEVIEHDPTMVSLLGSPPDSTYGRDSIEDLWAELVENEGD